jgi:transcriptional regulator with XRE-family HTH domain
MGSLRNEEYILAFATHLRALRIKKGLTLNDIHINAGMELSSVERIEKRQGNITISTLYALAKAMNVHPRELLDFDFDEN